MKLTLLIFLIIALPIASATTIQGSVYDFSLNEIKAIVTINTIPEQKAIGTNYIFEVSPGAYTLKAKHADLETEEQITIKEDGIFVIDLILFSALDEEDIPNIDININLDDEDVNNNWVVLVIVIVLALIIILAFIRTKRYRKPVSQENKCDKVADTEKLETQEKSLDTDAQNILNFIKQHQRTTQKEIRKHFPSSEAKISLILTQLESESKIKKIKKGRGNVIIAN